MVDTCDSKIMEDLRTEHMKTILKHINGDTFYISVISFSKN